MYMHMNIKFNSAESYVAPALEVLDAAAEDVLCASVSGTGTIDDLTFGDFQW